MDLFHIVVRMRQTIQVSLKSALSQRDYNGVWGAIFNTLHIRIEVLEDNRWNHISWIQQNKKKNKIIFLEGVKIDFIAP